MSDFFHVTCAHGRGPGKMHLGAVPGFSFSLTVFHSHLSEGGFPDSAVTHKLSPQEGQKIGEKSELEH